MNFLEAIEPFNDRLDVYQKLKTSSGIRAEDLRLLADIFLKYVASPRGDMPPLITCRPCVAKMFQRLVTHREQERQKNVDFINSVLKQSENTITISSGEVEVVQRDLEDQIAEEEKTYFEAEDGVSPNKMSWGKFKKYCTTKGLKVKGKTRKQLSKELGL